MLCPEAWNFEAPTSNFSVETVKVDDTHLRDIIQNFYFNHLVSVIIPDTLQVPTSLSSTLVADCEYYKIEDINISELINTNFIKNFVRKGSVFALSINTRIDCDDCVCVTPKGLIILSLTKDTYQTLGLEGRVSHFAQRNKERHIVYVDLLKEYLKPGKKIYERTKLCLNNLKFTIILNWLPFKESICPSSIAKYFHDLNYKVTSCVPDFQTRTDYSVKVPESFSEDNAEEFIEWLGAFSVQSDLGGPCDNYISTYETPEPTIQCGQVKFLQWKGFFMPNQIERLFTMLLDYFGTAHKPWISLYVQGFSDSPISWKLQEHHYYTNGDNAYIALIDSEKCLVGKQTCSKKCYKRI